MSLCVLTTYKVPENSCEEKNEVESDGDFLEFFLPQLDLPVIQESQAEEETSQRSSQVSRVPVCIPRCQCEVLGLSFSWKVYLRCFGLNLLGIVTVQSVADVESGENHNESQAESPVR